jgi:hypothetical protein
MLRRVGLTACALVLLAVTTAAAQQVVTGTIVRLDPNSSVVVLDNGTMYQATPQTVFLVNNRPTNFAALAPGTPIVVQHGQPVVYRDGRYVVMTQPAPVVVAPAQPTTVVTPAPPATVVTTPVRTADGMYEVSGVVKYSDANRGIIRFDDGRNVSIDENTQVLAGGSPAMLSTLRPGTFVVIRSSKPFAFRNNTYYVTTAPATPVVATTPPNVITGTVTRFDQPNMIVLSDGRVVPATAQTTVMVDNRAVPYTTLQPGTRVMIYPNGYAVAEPSALPSAAVYSEMGLREKEMERNAP